uniref:Reverse transcriptase domain-containing protein n=1 Tax=Amphimedon queenslandica TaxID=400682 RepID=A0A1X7SXQ2_AMPQE
MLTEEIKLLSQQIHASERLVVFSSVILQRDKMIKSAKEVRRIIDRRLSMWSEEKFDLLVQEAVRCDRSFHLAQKRQSSNQSPDHIAKVFTRLMLLGKVKAAMRWFSGESRSGLLLPTDSVQLQSNGQTSPIKVVDALKLKHPEAQLPCSSTLLLDTELPPFEDIDITGSHVATAAHRIQGSGGPGGCESSHWKDVLLRYGPHSSRCRDAVASLVSLLSNSIVDWNLIRALLANRLIALDKHPGIRPIGIGETLRRILSKVVCLITRTDAEEVCGSSQLCAGVQCSIEGAIHSARDMFNSHDWGLLMVDARNAFNSLNRSSLLWNIRILWPRASRFVFNTYKGHSPLIIKGYAEVLFSREGVIQGDPLSMFVYAVGTVPLIQTLKEFISTLTQIWYADDASVTGELSDIREWFDRLLLQGPKFGYYPEPHKSCLVVKESMVPQAQKLFGDLGIKITTSNRLLGSVIGDTMGCEAFVTKKVQGWINLINVLSDIAVTQPQAAYCAYTKSLQNEWTFLQRVTPDCQFLFIDLESVICNTFIPALFGQECSTSDRSLFSLPLRLGGLNIRNPVTTAAAHYTASRSACKLLINAVTGATPFSSYDHICQVHSARESHSLSRREVDNSTFTHTLSSLNDNNKRTVKRTRDCLSSWLNVLPVMKDNFDLSCNEFRDALCLRYAKPLLNLPQSCDGCSNIFTTSHALDCKKGGLIRDVLYDMSSLAWSQVIKEPVVKEAQNGLDGLIGDISVRGVWQSQSTTIFDVRVVDSDAPSYTGKPPLQVLKTAERDKKNKYGEACNSIHCSFIPLCMTVDGLLGPETNTFLKRMADKLSIKWDRPYSTVIYWIRTRLSFALLRATKLC